jgi:hypothetical protein
VPIVKEVFSFFDLTKVSFIKIETKIKRALSNFRHIRLGLRRFIRIYANVNVSGFAKFALSKSEQENIPGGRLILTP